MLKAYLYSMIISVEQTYTRFKSLKISLVIHKKFFFSLVFKFLASSAATCSRWFFARGFFYPEDGGDTILRNVGPIDHIYTAPHPRRRHSSK
jgi:hypothetical protein